MKIKKEKNVKLIIFLDDDNKTKNKEVIILKQNEFGVKIRLFNSSINKIIDTPAFFIPWHRILKIKDRDEK